MNPRQRDSFDQILEEVLAALPAAVTRMIEEIPLVVEDRPSKKLLRELGIEHSDELCGLYSGVPLTDPTGRESRQMPDSILIFREGILAEAADEHGVVAEAELRRQIRITILHEMGHHHGLDEGDLESLGYQ